MKRADVLPQSWSYQNERKQKNACVLSLPLTMLFLFSFSAPFFVVRLLFIFFPRYFSRCALAS